MGWTIVNTNSKKAQAVGTAKISKRGTYATISSEALRGWTRVRYIRLCWDGKRIALIPASKDEENVQKLTHFKRRKRGSGGGSFWVGTWAATKGLKPETRFTVSIGTVMGHKDARILSKGG